MKKEFKNWDVWEITKSEKSKDLVREKHLKIATTKRLPRFSKHRQRKVSPDLVLESKRCWKNMNFVPTFLLLSSNRAKEITKNKKTKTSETENLYAVHITRRVKLWKQKVTQNGFALFLRRNDLRKRWKFQPKASKITEWILWHHRDMKNKMTQHLRSDNLIQTINVAPRTE